MSNQRVLYVDLLEQQTAVPTAMIHANIAETDVLWT